MAELDRDRPNPWVTKTSETVYDNPWITVTHREVIAPTGTDGIYGHVHFKNLAVGILPIDDEDHTWLVGQYRYAPDEWSWELPAGGGNLREDPIQTANRELAEECGLVAATWDVLQQGVLSNSVTDERLILYLATDLSPAKATPDPTEQLELARVPVTTALEMAVQGEITHSMTIMSLYRWALRQGIMI